MDPTNANTALASAFAEELARSGVSRHGRRWNDFGADWHHPVMRSETRDLVGCIGECGDEVTDV